MIYLFLSIITSLFTVNTDFREIANEFGAEYIGNNKIVVSNDGTALICVPDSEEEILSKAILLQSFEDRLSSLNNNVREMVVFDNMVLLREGKQLILFKLSDYKVSSRLKEKLGKFISIDLYGFGRKTFEADGNILFNEAAVSKALKGYFSKPSQEEISNSCACSGYTASCGCSNKHGGCSVGCSLAAYACCTRPVSNDQAPTCKCVAIKEVEGN